MLVATYLVTGRMGSLTQAQWCQHLWFLHGAMLTSSHFDVNRTLAGKGDLLVCVRVLFINFAGSLIQCIFAASFRYFYSFFE